MSERWVRVAIRKHDLELFLEQPDGSLSTIRPRCPWAERYWLDVVERVELLELCLVEVFVTTYCFWVYVVVVHPFPYVVNRLVVIV